MPEIVCQKSLPVISHERLVRVFTLNEAGAKSSIELKRVPLFLPEKVPTTSITGFFTIATSWQPGKQKHPGEAETLRSKDGEFVYHSGQLWRRLNLKNRKMFGFHHKY